MADKSEIYARLRSDFMAEQLSLEQPLPATKPSIPSKPIALQEPRLVRWTLTFIALGFLALFLVLPLVMLFLLLF